MNSRHVKTTVMVAMISVLLVGLSVERKKFHKRLHGICTECCI